MKNKTDREILTELIKMVENINQNHIYFMKYQQKQNELVWKAIRTLNEINLL